MEVRNYVALFNRFGLLVLIYTACRILFWIFNYHAFQEASLTTIWEAFLLGVRFDLAALCMVNVLFIIASAIPFSFVSGKSYQKFLKILYLVSNIPFIIINLIDVEFYKFRGKRITHDVLGIAGDVKDQSIQLIAHYWYLGFGAILFTWLLIRFYPKLNEHKWKNKLTWKTGIPSFLIIISLGFVSFRGIGLKPIRPTNAFVLSPNKLGNLVLNTPFVFLLSFDMKGVERVDYFKDPEEVLSLIQQTPIGETEPVKKDNVVIIILESFASEYLGIGNTYKGYTPFLDSLAREGLFFRNNFANGRQSIEALPSIMASVPSLMNEPYITSIYQTNRIKGLGSILSKEGYRTAFFHGGKNGTMSFDVFAKNAGFDEYYGLNEYPEATRDYDGNWGIFDKPYLQYVSQKLSGFNQPFVSGIFTLSSHQPYTIPAEYKGKFPKGDLEVHETIGYVDHALRKFFESARKEKWYKNTLFVITADHTHMNSRPEYQNVIGEYKVPLIFYHPGKNLPSTDTGQVTQHADILPSVLDYLNIQNEERISFGKSVFDTTSSGEAINYSNGTYRLIRNNFFLEYSSENGSRLYDFRTDKNQKRNLNDHEKERGELEEKLKAYIQYYNNGLIENSWYGYQKP